MSNRTIMMPVSGLEVEVTFKTMKYLQIYVCPPDGRVRVSVPHRVSQKAVRAAIVERLSWIAAQQERMRALPAPAPSRMITGETHDVWGQPLRLDVSQPGRAAAHVDGNTLMLISPSTSTEEQRQRILDRWYRQQLVDAVPPLLTVWEPVVGRRASAVTIRRMKTRWGSCQPSTGKITLNLELAKHDPSALEYVIVHELTHLIEPSHNARFYVLMDSFLPDWKSRRSQLNAQGLR